MKAYNTLAIITSGYKL